MWYYMAGTTTTERMTEEGRALLTEAEREIIAGERDVTDNYEYKVRSLVRNRVRKKLGDDVELLRTKFPEVYDMIRAGVCEDLINDTTDEDDDTRRHLHEELDHLQSRLDSNERQLARRIEDVERLEEQRRQARIERDRLEAALERGDRPGIEEAVGRLRAVMESTDVE